MHFKQLKYFIILLFSVIILCGADSEQKEMYFYEKPYPASKIEFKTEDNKAISLKDFAGKVVLLNMWSTTCAACIIELPALDKLQTVFPETDFAIVALNSKWSSDPTGLRKFYELHDIKNLKVYTDSGEFFYKSTAALGYPTTILINQRGEEIARVRGMINWNDKEFVEKLKKIIYDKPITTQKAKE